MPRVRELSEFERGLVVGFRKGGFSYREIVKHLNRNKCTILLCYQALLRKGQELK